MPDPHDNPSWPPRDTTNANAPPHDEHTPPLSFEVLAVDGRARASVLALAHHDCRTPMFMPVGTQGSVKGLTSAQLLDIECQVVLGNTYHLGNRPGADVVAQAGGLRCFMNWPRATLTDSGGFQMVSLLDLADITEEGVTFQSPTDGSQMLLTPEKSIEIQNDIGADIIMALDDVVSSVTADRARFEEATHRTTRWIDRCIAAHKRPNAQSLFGIVQGGLDLDLRDVSLKGLLARGDNLPGFAIGGLAGGESKEDFVRIVAHCAVRLPENKPRYIMGVGYPLDLVVCTALGADMYDCVYPSRTARFGTALVPEGMLRLKSHSNENDHRPIEAECDCLTCKHYTRAQLHKIATKEPRAANLLTIHNLRYQMRLCSAMHTAIIEQRFGAFARDFIYKQFPSGDIPLWVRQAMEYAEIDLIR